MSNTRNRRSTTTPKYDMLIIVAVASLVIIGLLMVYSTTTFRGVDFAVSDDANSMGLFVRQVEAVVIGLIGLIFLAKVEYHIWRRFSVLILVLMILLLIAVLFIGHEQNGSRRWLFGGSIQPSEAAKVAMIIYAAHWLSSKGQRIRDITYGLLPFGALLAVMCVLIYAQEDLSTAALIALTAMTMFFIAGGEVKQIIGLAVPGVSLAAALYVLIRGADFRLQRILSFINSDPLTTSSDATLQIHQGLIALARGGLFGRGLGNSVQKFGYIPAVHTDSILAVLGEELGLIGCLMVVGLFAFLAYRGFRVAMNAADSYGALLAAGLTCSLIFQAVINIAVVTNTFPATGIPLPFISYGGTSMAVSLASVGLLLSVSRRTLPDGEMPIEGEKTDYGETDDFGRRNRRTRVSRPGRRRMANN